MAKKQERYQNTHLFDKVQDFNPMDEEAIKQMAIDVNNVASVSFQSGKEFIEKPLLARIKILEDELEAKKVECEKYLRIATERAPSRY